jgi:alcohol dehydrogenase (NADP+)
MARDMFTRGDVPVLSTSTNVVVDSMPMSMKIPAYGTRAAKAPLEPLTIDRRKPRPFDVGIEILYCGICHSDLHRVNDDWGNTHFPVVPGHEIIGRVVARGASASRFRIGDLVGVGCIVDSCRACSECLAGREMFCEKGVTFSFDSLEQDKKTLTYGGYSTNMVVDERYVLRVPKGLDPAGAAPLMCGGITTYSPLHQFGCKPGDRVAVIGLGGLGHLAVKLAASMGGTVTVLSTSSGKEQDAARLGAKRFISIGEPGVLDVLAGTFSLILDTVSAPHDLNRELNLLQSFGTLVLVGLPPGLTPLDAGRLIHGNKRIAGTNIGGIPETQKMLDYCGEHGITADIELIKMQDINEAYKRMVKNDVKYRFVIDMSSLKAG